MKYFISNLDAVDKIYFSVAIIIFMLFALTGIFRNLIPIDQFYVFISFFAWTALYAAYRTIRPAKKISDNFEGVLIPKPATKYVAIILACLFFPIATIIFIYLFVFFN